MLQVRHGLNRSLCYNNQKECAVLAQLVEHRIRNAKVAGSIPADGSTKGKYMKTRVSSAFQLLLADRALLFLAAGIVIAVVLYSLYVAFSLSPTELQVATRYTAFGETQLYRNTWYYLISFIVVAGVMAIVHVGLMAKLKARGVRPMAFALGWLTLLMIALLFVVTQRVLSSAYLS